MLHADPHLVESWLRARSVARGLPSPTADQEGWCVETGSPTEHRRYLFARPVSRLRELAHQINEPRLPLKLFGSAEEMKAILPARWQLQAGAMMMTCEAPISQGGSLPKGYVPALSHAGDVTSARILSASGQPAASGYAAETEGIFVYDRIVVDPDHRRQGLGRALMSILGSTRREPTATQVLVATVDGRALYSTLGWKDRSPYTTAVIPDAEQAG